MLAVRRRPDHGAPWSDRSRRAAVACLFAKAASESLVPIAARRLRTLASSVVRDATDGTATPREEIFGPISPVLPYRDLDDATAYVDALATLGLSAVLAAIMETARKYRAGRPREPS